VNDFRKIAASNAMRPPTTSPSSPARTNDEGWASVFVEWLRGSRLNRKDALLILSVGGGNLEKNVSPNLVTRFSWPSRSARASSASSAGTAAYTAKVADACVIVPIVNPSNITPHSEAFQAVIWHLFVSHPDLKAAQTKWESISPGFFACGEKLMAFAPQKPSTWKGSNLP